MFTQHRLRQSRILVNDGPLEARPSCAFRRFQAKLFHCDLQVGNNLQPEPTLPLRLWAMVGTEASCLGSSDLTLIRL